MTRISVPTEKGRTMAEYVNKEMFLSSMGLVGDETKYGNRDSEHQGRSYGTWMGYEIVDSIDDCVEEDVVKVVRCKDCKHSRQAEWYRAKLRCTHPSCMCRQVPYDVPPNHFCSYGERRTDA